MPREHKKRVIVDTNCWISFLIGKKLSCILDLLSNERIQLVVCQELIDEIRDVTSRPKFSKYFPKKDVESLLDFMLLIGERFEPQQQVQLCRDEADDYLLALAIDAKAQYLITGDQDLLVLKEVGTCRIITASSFEDEMR